MGRDKLSKLYMGNINNQATEADLRKFLVGHGINESHISAIWLKRGFAFLDCQDQTTADEMIDKIHDQEFQGKKLLLEPSLTSGVNHKMRTRMSAAGMGSTDSLKILIPSEYVGAIIGRGGSNIKDLTVSTGARINILRNHHHVPTAEKTACIVGAPENCSSACRKILEICFTEASNLKEGKEISLKILANNSLVGKIIGKEGRNIKKIMQDTQTKIHVSNQVQSESLTSDMWNPLHVERVITIRGSIDGMCTAEQLISSKLKVPDMDVLRSTLVPPGFFPLVAPGFPMSPFNWNGRYGRLQSYANTPTTRNSAFNHPRGHPRQ